MPSAVVLLAPVIKIWPLSGQEPKPVLSTMAAFNSDRKPPLLVPLTIKSIAKVDLAVVYVPSSVSPDF